MAQDAAVGTDPTAFNPVRFTRQVSRSNTRGRTRVRDVLIDAYSALLAAGTVGALAAGLVLALREQVSTVWNGGDAGRTLTEAPWIDLPDGAASIVLVFAALVAVLGMARKFGPAAVAPAEGYWWLSLPVDRRPMIAGRLVRRLILVWAGAAVLYLPIGFITNLDAGPVDQLGGAAVFGLAALCAVLAAAVRQAGLGPRPLGPDAGSAVLGAAAGPIPGLVLLAALSFLPGLAAAGVIWAGAAALAAAVGLGLLVFPRLDRIPGRELIRGGGVSGHAGAALFLMDPNELGRALTSAPGTGIKRSHRAHRWYAQSSRKPFGALLRADTTAFLRTPGLWGRPLLLLALCTALLLTGGSQPVLLQLALVAVAICAAVPAMGALARQTAITPGLDMLLPLSPAVVRLSRLALPAAASAVWAGTFCAALVLLGAGSPALIVLGALAGLGFGAAAVRGAYRPQPDWTAPPAETVFGPVPTAQAGSMIRGLDTTLLALVPLLLGLFLGYAPGVLLLAQAGVSAVCVLVVMYSNPK